MSDAAQGELQDHEVFRKPMKVDPAYEQWPTPGNYRDYAMGAALPETMKVWRVQKVRDDRSPSDSVIAFHYAFLDSPDAEILTAGYNQGKENGAVGVGRQGNYLQWGFSGSPSQMTPAGQAFFVNCICYIQKFDGKPPLVERQTFGRDYSIYLASLIGRIQDPDFLKSIASPELLAKYKGNPKGLVSYLQENKELIYAEEGCRVDEELPSLGLKSNREVQTLEQLVGYLRDPAKREVTTKLLKRYTTQRFKTPEEWDGWLAQSKGRIFFSDAGGYKFMVMPEGYLTPKR